MTSTVHRRKTQAAQVRHACQDDIAGLMQLEKASFVGDRISLRSWRNLIASRSATVIVAGEPDSALGAAVVLHSARTSVARLYSIAVSASARGHGIARVLLDAATTRAREVGASVLRLETRRDNKIAQSLFRSHGFTQFKITLGYYHDGVDALRFQKSLW